VGVTADTIGVSAPGAAGGETARVVHDAVQRVNAGGGICGRLIVLRPDEAFATIAGTDAPPPAGLARIAMREAYERAGARTFALVYAAGSGDGVRGAFEAGVDALAGASVAIVEEASAPNATADVEAACAGSRCDFVLLDVPVSEGPRWLATAAPAAKRRIAGLTSELATACARAAPGTCAKLYVWDPSYASAQLLVDTLTATGPNLTREHFAATLAGMTHRFRAAPALRYGDGGLVDAGTGWVTDPKA
jgi:hypothetical protein